MSAAVIVCVVVALVIAAVTAWLAYTVNKASDSIERVKERLSSVEGKLKEERSIEHSHIKDHLDKLIQDMTNKDFTIKSLFAEKMTSSNVSGSNFTGSGYTGGNFTGSNFSGREFTGSNFAGSNFTGSNFTGSNFTGSNFTGQRLSLQHGTNTDKVSYMSIDGTGNVQMCGFPTSSGGWDSATCKKLNYATA